MANTTESGQSNQASADSASQNPRRRDNCSFLAEQLTALLYIASDSGTFDDLPKVAQETILNIAHEKAEALQAELSLLASTEGVRA
jgi:hypothetical protein